MRRLFDVNPITGSREFFHYDAEKDEFLIEVEEDVAPTLAANEAFRQVETGNWKGDMHLVASIPPTLVPDLAKQGIMWPDGRIRDEKKLQRWLCDRDNMKLRTKTGQL